MRLLVLGGTSFLGRAIVDDAVSRDYDVTTFSRGITGHPRPGAETLHGDRTNAGDLRQLAQRDWDAVIDTSTLAPAHVLAAARILAGRIRHYTYISSISVYAEGPGDGVTEESPVLDCPADATGTRRRRPRSSPRSARHARGRPAPAPAGQTRLRHRRGRPGYAGHS